MHTDSHNNFVYLNHHGRWPDFQWSGLDLSADGALQLCPLPQLESEPPADLADFKAPVGPAGIVVAVDGTVYLSDPSGHQLFKVDGCNGEFAAVPCIGGQGSTPVNLQTPRGLLIPAHRQALFVVDSHNHRLQVFDLATWQLLDVWGQREAANEPYPSAEPGRFNTPWTLAGDHHGNVYVVDYGNQRVQKFNRIGDLVPAFWETVQHSNLLSQPSDIAVYSRGETSRLYIVDQVQHAVFVFEADGHVVCDTQQQPVIIGANHLEQPMGIAVTEDAVYVGDNEHRRVLKFRTSGDYAYVGEAVGYQGPVAALALDGRENLLVHTGGALFPLRLALDTAYCRKGVLWSQAITGPATEVQWYRLQAVCERLADGAHFRLFVHTANDPTAPPPVDPAAPHPFSDCTWRPHAVGQELFSNVTEVFIGGAPARYVWIGALFTSDGSATPVVSQMRVEFNHDTYLHHLPAIYRNPAPCEDFLQRFLALFESFFAEAEECIANLTALFDPAAVPRPFLPWLASWLALTLDEDWHEEQQRQAIAEAFMQYSRRGTAVGLRQALRSYAGVDAVIEEPLLHAAWWALPSSESSCQCVEVRAPSPEAVWEATEHSVLGVTTMLAPAAAQGAVLGTSATLDASHLITGADFGMPLFEDVAHQFSVQVYRGQLQCAETLPQVHAVIEREKPAHTAYHLCIVEARMRVGFQARVGIDTVVAGAPPASKLDDQMVLDTDVALGGHPAGRIGERSQVGMTTRVG